MADSVLLEGLSADGGLIYERREDGSLDTDRHWWPQAEAMVGFVNAWQISGDVRFADAALRVWGFVREYLIDRQNGEWYWLVDSNGKPSAAEDKTGPWKCPYHNGRACMELMDRLPV
jgi:cellobiose epimerase